MAREKQPLCPVCGTEMRPSLTECWCPWCEKAEERAKNRAAGGIKPRWNLNLEGFDPEVYEELIKEAFKIPKF